MPTTDILEANATTIEGFRLTVVSGPDEGLVHTASRERVVVGAHATADVVLRDRAVSRFHCELTAARGGVLVRDLDSRNGTRIGKVAIVEAVLEEPTVLAIGATELRVERISDEIAIPLASDERFGDLVGGSSQMRAVFSVLDRAARSRANLLVEGGPGVGKRTAAAAVHAMSGREGAFGVVDCTHPEHVLRRELFGDEEADEPGAFELCDGGTLVLDDLGALAPALQVEVLRALDDAAVRRTGGVEKQPVDVRVIGTTRRNLRRDVNAGRLKTGLYSLVAVLRVRIPELRERPTDIPLLVADILDELGAADSPAAAALRDYDSMESLRTYAWPDNVRELETYVQRCVALEQVVSPDDASDAEHAPVLDPTMPLREAREEWVRYFERRYLGALLELTEQNVSAAARRAGVDRVHMHRLLKSAGLR